MREKGEVKEKTGEERGMRSGERREGEGEEVTRGGRKGGSRR